MQLETLLVKLMKKPTPEKISIAVHWVPGPMTSNIAVFLVTPLKDSRGLDFLVCGKPGVSGSRADGQPRFSQAQRAVSQQDPNTGRTSVTPLIPKPTRALLTAALAVGMMCRVPMAGLDARDPGRTLFGPHGSAQPSRVSRQCPQLLQDECDRNARLL